VLASHILDAFVAAALMHFSGRLCDRFGVRIMTVLGFAMCTPSLVCLQFVTQDGISHKVLLAALMALCGLALSVAQPALYVESQIVLEEMEEHCLGIFEKQGILASIRLADDDQLCWPLCGAHH
jgi:MFS family permease